MLLLSEEGFFVLLGQQPLLSDQEGGFVWGFSKMGASCWEQMPLRYIAGQHKQAM